MAALDLKSKLGAVESKTTRYTFQLGQDQKLQSVEGKDVNFQAILDLPTMSATSVDRLADEYTQGRLAQLKEAARQLKIAKDPFGYAAEMLTKQAKALGDEDANIRTEVATLAKAGHTIDEIKSIIPQFANAQHAISNTDVVSSMGGGVKSAPPIKRSAPKKTRASPKKKRGKNKK